MDKIIRMSGTPTDHCVDCAQVNLMEKGYPHRNPSLGQGRISVTRFMGRTALPASLGNSLFTSLQYQH